LKRVIFALVTTAVGLVLLLSYKTTANRAQSPAAAAGGPTPTSTGSTTSSGAGASGSGSRSALGDVVDTRWGPVQIKVTSSGGKIVDVQAVQYPDGNPRDAEINSQALPLLRSEALNAQSAQIDMVSGATVTSQGYLQSLQSALDKLNGA
jgi:uncharacterized protein with FMN-binding domain